MNKTIENHIKSVTRNLRPTTGLEGKFDPPQTLRERLAHYHTPGVSVAVVNDFQVEWARGFGVADVRHAERVTTRTLFQAGSISKPVTALGVMRLVQDGRLSLDDDINQVLTTWRVPANDGWQPRITLRQILSHTAGFTVHGFPGYQASEPLPTVAQVLSGQVPANTPPVQVNILPGMQFRYSGGGTTVAQQALIDLLQKPFPEIMRELVLAPLGLAHSTYEQPLPKRWAAGAATAHPWKGIPVKGRFHTYPEMAAAGLWTTAGDLAALGAELLNVLHDRRPPAALAKASIDAMLQPQLASQKAGQGDYVGLGFFCSGEGDAFQFGHGGWDEGFVADIRFYRELGQGAVIMVNSNEGHALIPELRQAIAEEYGWPDSQPKRKALAGPANMVDYAGVYAPQAGAPFRVSAAGGGLLLQVGQQQPLPLFASAETEFFAEAVNSRVRFEKDSAGKVAALIVSQDGNQVKADKQTQEPA